MMKRALIAFFLLWAVAPATVPASAQTGWVRQTVTSEAPSSVSVTVYRNPDRADDNGMDLNYLGGYALITEQRTVTLPAGEIDLRFEGVAGGIIPQSSIVTGLPDGVIEKNRDAALLSPSALLNGHLGRGVTIRRTSAATGEVEEFDAQVRTDASGGMVLQTAEGFEALQCTGLNETIIYPEIPEGLSAKPTLSVKSRVTTPIHATITLSYLATGFDWQANYVADIGTDGETLNLFSWVTLANGDETSFVDARAQTVAGEPNKGRDNIQRPEGGSIALRCWPQGTTSDIQVKEFERARDQARYSGVPMPAPMAAMDAAAERVTLTARRIEAKQEDLGDLKLYRIPVPVTVASQSQKQVAMFEKTAIPFEQIYEREIWAANDRGNAEDALPLNTTLRFQNLKRDSLGLPLPAGQMVIFKAVDGERIMLGEGGVDDKAIGEEVEVTIGQSPLVRYQLQATGDSDSAAKIFALTISNASQSAAQVEILLGHQDNQKIHKASERLSRKDGHDLWKVTVPAHGKRVLTYQIKSN